MACCLTPGTCRARMYIFSNHGEESWPVESAADEVDHFPLAQVTRSGVVMMVADDLQAYVTARDTPGTCRDRGNQNKVMCVP